MQRREFVVGLVAAGAFAVTGNAAGGDAVPDVEALRRNWRDFLDPGATAPEASAKLEHPASEWQRLLTPAQYRVLREEGTERPFTSPLNDEKRPGIYACAGCGLPLFTSAMKYESGTGWPSFFTTIPDVFGTKNDWTLLVPRTEYHCIRCGGHHGHVFDDGPRPTGERWCNNGVALEFIPRRA
jgi:peptide-methionine (R)-S-oxide reductase